MTIITSPCPRISGIAFFIAIIAGHCGPGLCAEATSTDGADRILPVKSLKLISVQADRTIWKVTDDSVDADGDTNFDLAHLQSEGTVKLGFSESFEDTDEMTAESVLQQLAELRKAEMPGERVTKLPAKFIVPAGNKCKAFKKREGVGKQAYWIVDIHCVSVHSGMWLSTSVMYADALTPRQMADVNRVLATVTVRDATRDEQGKPPKASVLKKSDIDVDKAIWGIRKELVADNGATFMYLKHLQSPELGFVLVSEIPKEAAGRTAENAIVAFMDELNNGLPGSKVVPNPAGFSGHPGSDCRSLLVPERDPKAGTTTRVFCILPQQGWYLLSAFAYTKAPNKKQIGDISQLLATLIVKLRQPMPKDAATSDVKERDAASSASPDSKSHNISIVVGDIDLRTFLRLYLERSGIRLVLSPSVTGKLTYQATEKAWGGVLDEILTSNGLSISLPKGPPRVVMIGRACELDFVAQQSLLPQDAKRLGDSQAAVNLNFSEVSLESLGQLLGDFTGVPVHMPESAKETRVTIQGKDFPPLYLLHTVLAIGGYAVQDSLGNQKDVNLIRSSEKCFTDMIYPQNPHTLPRMPDAGERRKEFLELYGLDEIQFKGYIRDSSRPVAKQLEIFSMTKDGFGARITNGARIGKDFGTVTAISETGAEIREMLLSRGGEWYEKKITWPKK